MSVCLNVTSRAELKFLLSGLHGLMEGVPLFIDHQFRHVLKTHYVEAITIMDRRIVYLVPGGLIVEQTVVEGVDNEGKIVGPGRGIV